MPVLTYERKATIVLLYLPKKEGSYYQYKDDSATVETFKVKPVDTTGAGDVFYASILAHLDSSSTLDKEIIINILQRSNICGGLACTKKGAISALPTQNELNETYFKLYK